MHTKDKNIIHCSWDDLTASAHITRAAKAQHREEKQNYYHNLENKNRNRVAELYAKYKGVDVPKKKLPTFKSNPIKYVPETDEEAKRFENWKLLEAKNHISSKKSHLTAKDFKSIEDAAVAIGFRISQ